MAAFDANLLLLNNAAMTSAGGVALVTGAFVDLGTGGTPAGGLSIRMDLNTADADGSTIQMTYQLSDNSSTVQEQVVLPSITGTDARTTGGVERLTRFAHKRRYVRYRATLTGAAASVTGTIGIDAGDFNQNR
jgi:hypothetical protein